MTEETLPTTNTDNLKMTTQYTLRSAGMRSSVSRPMAPISRRRANSELSALAPPPGPDSSPWEDEDYHPRARMMPGAVDFDAILQSEPEMGPAMPSAPLPKRGEAQDEEDDIPFYTPGRENPAYPMRDSSAREPLVAEDSNEGWTTVVRKCSRRGVRVETELRQNLNDNLNLSRMLSEAEQHLSVNDRKRISKRSGAEAAALDRVCRGYG
ncbi:hypothetical protein V8E55_003249 [Tylopilus felleus]